jgi:hypothetical protein
LRAGGCGGEEGEGEQQGARSSPAVILKFAHMWSPFRSAPFSGTGFSLCGFVQARSSAVQATLAG